MLSSNLNNGILNVIIFYWFRHFCSKNFLTNQEQAVRVSHFLYRVSHSCNPNSRLYVVTGGKRQAANFIFGINKPSSRLSNLHLLGKCT